MFKRISCLFCCFILIFSIQFASAETTYQYPSVVFKLMADEDEFEFRQWVYNAMIDYVNNYFYLYDSNNSFGNGNQQIQYKTSYTVRPWEEYYKFGKYKIDYFDGYFSTIETHHWLIHSIVFDTEKRPASYENLSVQDKKDLYTIAISKIFEDQVVADASVYKTYLEMGKDERKYYSISPSGTLTKDDLRESNYAIVHTEAKRAWIDLLTDVLDLGTECVIAGIDLKTADKKDFKIAEMIEHALSASISSVLNSCTDNAITAYRNYSKTVIAYEVLDAITKMDSTLVSFLNNAYRGEVPIAGASDSDLELYIKPVIYKYLDMYRKNELMKETGESMVEITNELYLQIQDEFDQEIERLLSASAIFSSAALEACKTVLVDAINAIFKEINKKIGQNPNMETIDKVLYKVDIVAVQNLITGSISDFFDIAIEKVKENSLASVPKDFQELLDDTCDEFRDNFLENRCSGLVRILSGSVDTLLDKNAFQQYLQGLNGHPIAQLAYCLCFWAVRTIPKAQFTYLADSQETEEDFRTKTGKEILSSIINDLFFVLTSYFECAGESIKGCYETTEAKSKVDPSLVEKSKELKVLMDDAMMNSKIVKHSTKILLSVCGIATDSIKVINASKNANETDYNVETRANAVYANYQLSAPFCDDFLQFISNNTINDILNSSKISFDQLKILARTMKLQVAYDANGILEYQNIVLNETEYYNSLLFKYMRDEKINISGYTPKKYVNVFGGEGRLISISAAKAYHEIAINMLKRLSDGWKTEWDAFIYSYQ